MMAVPMDLPEYKMIGTKIIQLQMAKSELGAPKLVHSEHEEGSGRGGLLVCLGKQGQHTQEGERLPGGGGL